MAISNNSINNKSNSVNGGVVDLGMIIEQIIAVEEGLDTIVDIIVNSSDDIIKKARIALNQINESSNLFKLIFEKTNLLIKTATSLKIDDFVENFKIYIGDPAIIQQIMDADFKDINLEQVKQNPLVFSVVISKSIGAICKEIKCGHVVSTALKMANLAMTILVLNTGLINIAGLLRQGALSMSLAIPDFTLYVKHLTTFFTALNTLITESVTGLDGNSFWLKAGLGVRYVRTNLKLIVNILNVINTYMKIIRLRIYLLSRQIHKNDFKHLIKVVYFFKLMSSTFDAILASLITSIFKCLLIVILMPVILISLQGLAIYIMGMAIILKIIGSKKVRRFVHSAISGVNRLLKMILRAIIRMALAIVAIVVIVLLLCLVGKYMPQLFQGFALGLIVVAIAFGMIVLALKVLQKVSATAARSAVRSALNIMIMALAFAIICILVLIMIQASESIEDTSLTNICILIGLMVTVVGLMVGLMLAASAAAPAISIGIIALGIVMVGFMAMMLLIGIVYLIMVISNEINEKEYQAGIKKIIDCITFTIKQLIDADFGFGNDKEDSGIISKISSFTGIDFLSSMINIISKIATLVAAIIALGCIYILTNIILSISNLYNENKDIIKEVPENVKTIITVCGEITNVLIDTQFANFSTNTEGGLFMPLVSLVSPSLAGVLNLISRLFVVMISIMVLLMVKLLFNEMVWIYKSYNEMGGDQIGDNIVHVVNNIIDAVYQIITALSTSKEDPNGKPKDGLDKLLSFCGLDEIATIINLLCSFVFIGIAIVALGVILATAGIMKGIWEVYDLMGGDEIANNAIKMTKGIISGVNAIIMTLKESKIDFGEADTSNSNLIEESMIKLIKGIFGDGITGVIDVLAQSEKLYQVVPILAQLEACVKLMEKTYKDTQKQMNNIQSLSTDLLGTLLGNIQNMVSQVNNFDVGSIENLDNNLMKINLVVLKISKTFNKLLGKNSDKALAFLVQRANQYTKVVNDTDKLISGVAKIDLAKMKVLAEVFGHAAAFSQSINGNFDRLADVIKDKLGPILEGLNRTIKDADEHINAYVKKIEQCRNEIKRADEAAMKRKAAEDIENAKGKVETNIPTKDNKKIPVDAETLIRAFANTLSTRDLRIVQSGQPWKITNVG